MIYRDDYMWHVPISCNDFKSFDRFYISHNIIKVHRSVFFHPDISWYWEESRTMVVRSLHLQLSLVLLLLYLLQQLKILLSLPSSSDYGDGVEDSGDGRV